MKYRLILSFGFLTILSCQPRSEKESIANGKEVYITNCVTCHQPDGKGIEGLYPSLIKPNMVSNTQTQRAIHLIKYGSDLEIGMKPVALTEDEIVEVINYIQNTWGNSAPILTKIELKKMTNN